MVTIFADFTVDEAVTPVPTLNKWNYPTFGMGVNARTYTAAATAAALPTGAAYPLQYRAGAEGVLSIVRTAVGKYTLTLQDRYQRVLQIDGHAATASGTPVFAKLTENTTITSMSTATGSIIGLAFWDFAAAAVDPIGEVKLRLVLSNSTAP
jgi:hypothetical protein